jgi:hypothetical protein
MPSEFSSESLKDRVRRWQRHPVYQRLRTSYRAVAELGPSTWRLATSGWRRLPSAVIVGAQKAGTTQLYSSLLQHPNCAGSSVKEVSYFSKHPDRSVAWYRSHFPFAGGGLADQNTCLEASPSYLPNPGAICRMWEVLPDAKVIAILRDPVSRAFSHYQHQKARGRETRSFETAVRESIAVWPEVPRWGVATGPESLPMLDYVARGYYAMQLECLLQHYPRSNVLVLDSAELFADTSAVCQQVFAFLGLETHPVAVTKIYNRGGYREKVDPATAEFLRRHYEPHDRTLRELLGREFGWMSKADSGMERAA